MNEPSRPKEEDGSVALVQKLAGRVTYRQIDYWCRTGQITLEHPGDGPGSRRRISPAEAFAIEAVVSEVEELNLRIDRLRSGAFFKNALMTAEYFEKAAERGEKSENVP